MTHLCKDGSVVGRWPGAKKGDEKEDKAVERSVVIQAVRVAGRIARGACQERVSQFTIQAQTLQHTHLLQDCCTMLCARSASSFIGNQGDNGERALSAHLGGP